MMSTFQLGHTVPNFTLPVANGEVYSFEEQQKADNSWHLIIFFRGSWCPVCVHDLTEMQENKGFFDSRNVEIVAISTDTQENLAKMTDELKLTFPLLSDEGLQALKEYDVFYHGEDAPYEDHGIHGEPAYFLVDENGKLLYQQRQTSPFGRPSATELRKVVQYIKKQLKSK